MNSLVTLSGSLRTALIPCESESVAVGMFIKSGSRHEPKNCVGISHFIEHMLFKGTHRRSQLDITHAIEGRGGNFNAMTSEESTCYYTQMPYEYLYDAIDILCDMHLNAKISADEFEREKQIILEEIKMYADDASSVALENLQRALFPRHALGESVAGYDSTIKPLTTKDLKSYISSHYTADRTLVVIVGNFDPEKTAAYLEKTFAKHLKKRGAFDASLLEKPKKFLPPISEITTTKDIKQTQLALGYRTFSPKGPRKYVATVLDAIIGRGMSSRLFQEVREKEGLSYDISSRFQFFTDVGQFIVAAGVDPSNEEKTIAIIDREIKKLVSKRVGEDELKRAKEFLIGNFRLSLERAKAKLFMHGASVLHYNRIVPPEEQINAIRAVSSAELQKVASAVFNPSVRAISRVLPRS